MRVTAASVYLQNLRFHACHGVGEQEHKVGNDYLVSLRIDYPMAQATETDDLNDTLNYAEAYRIVSDTMAERSTLLEHVAGRMAQRLTEKFPEITTIDIDIRKLNPPIGADSDGAGVRICFKNDNQI